MIIDPKLERMFHQCHEHKKLLDRKRSVVRAFMFFPPVLIALGCFLAMAMSVVNGFLRTVLGSFIAAEGDVPGLLVSLTLAAFAAGETLLENKELIEVSDKFYPIAAVVCAVLALIFPDSRLTMLALIVYCIIAAVLNILFKRFYAENEMLRTLKGYPHFDILLMNERELREEESPDRKPLEELSPDERLMRERDMNL